MLKTNLPYIFTYLILVVLLASCARVPEAVAIEAARPKPIIFDTDMAHEDLFAALFLLGHPNADLKAITVAGTGEAHCAPGVRNALGLAALAGLPDLPIACGRRDAPAGESRVPG